MKPNTNQISNLYEVFISTYKYFAHSHLFTNISISFQPDIGMMVRVFSNGPGDLGLIPGQVIPKSQKMLLDASLLNTQHYNAQIKGIVEQSRQRSIALPSISV